jgi:hypothetical protein
MPLIKEVPSPAGQATVFTHRRRPALVSLSAPRGGERRGEVGDAPAPSAEPRGHLRGFQPPRYAKSGAPDSRRLPSRLNDHCRPETPEHAVRHPARSRAFARDRRSQRYGGQSDAAVGTSTANRWFRGRARTAALLRSRRVAAGAQSRSAVAPSSSEFPHLTLPSPPPGAERDYAGSREMCEYRSARRGREAAGQLFNPRRMSRR